MNLRSNRPRRAHGEQATHVRAVVLRAATAERAIALFDEGAVDVVLGGRIDSLPLAERFVHVHARHVGHHQVAEDRVAARVDTGGIVACCFFRAS